MTPHQSPENDINIKR